MSGRAFGDVLALARAHDLSAYDAAYLELAAAACRGRPWTDSSSRRRTPRA